MGAATAARMRTLSHAAIFPLCRLGSLNSVSQLFLYHTPVVLIFARTLPPGALGGEQRR